MIHNATELDIGPQETEKLTVEYVNWSIPYDGGYLGSSSGVLVTEEDRAPFVVVRVA